jgi:hypothetical protein
VADHTDRLPGSEDLLDEADRTLVTAQFIGVGDASRQHEAVIVVDIDLRDRPVDRKRRALVEMVERLNLARLGSDQVGRRAGLLDRFARRGQLDARRAARRAIVATHSEIPATIIASACLRRRRSATAPEWALSATSCLALVAARAPFSPTSLALWAASVTLCAALWVASVTLCAALCAASFTLCARFVERVLGARCAALGTVAVLKLPGRVAD